MEGSLKRFGIISDLYYQHRIDPNVAPDEVANVAELLMSDKGAFITGADFLVDGGATASYFYGPLKPQA